MEGPRRGRVSVERPQAYRVCLVVGELGLGGLERQVYLLATGLDRRRFDVTVVSLSQGGAWSEALARSGARVVHLERRGHMDLRRWLGLVRVFRKIRPDLVYSFQYATSAYARLAGLLTAVPILITGERGLHMTRARSVLEKLLLPFTECVVCNAETTRQDLVGRLGLAGHKVTTIPNGVELPPVEDASARNAVRRILGVTGEQCVVGTIARLEEVKNLPMLIQVAALCAKVDPRLRFRVIGGGPQEPLLRAAIRAQGVEPVFELLGKRDRAWDLLGGFDIFVLTSRSEGLPNALMEAMAAGVPCVCSDVGGCRELVLDGITGRFVNPGDVDAMASRVLELAGDDLQRDRMGRAGRRRIEETFSVAKLISRTERLFEQLLQAKDLRLRGHRFAPNRLNLAP